jgi:hypothetical protein
MEGRPFGKVKDLRFCSCGKACKLPLVVLPTMQCLEVMSWRSRSVRSITQPMIYPASKPQNCLLEKVYIGSTGILPAYVEHMIQSAWFAVLKWLRISNNCLVPESANRADDMPALIQSLEKYTPKLESLECTNHFCVSGSYKKIAYFQGLEHLKYLCISYDLLADRSSWQSLFECLRDMMSENLEVLTFANLDLPTLYVIATEILFEQIEAAEAATEQAPAPIFKTLVAAIPAKSLQLALIFGARDETQELIMSRGCYVQRWHLL